MRPPGWLSLGAALLHVCAGADVPSVKYQLTDTYSERTLRDFFEVAIVRHRWPPGQLYCWHKSPPAFSVLVKRTGRFLFY